MGKFHRSHRNNIVNTFVIKFVTNAKTDVGLRALPSSAPELRTAVLRLVEAMNIAIFGSSKSTKERVLYFTCSLTLAAGLSVLRLYFR